MGNCLPKIRKYRKQFSQQGNHTKIGYPKVQGCCGRMRNCLPKIRWKVPVPIRRKRYSHKQTQTYSHPPGTIKEHVARRDSMNSSELWYSTVSHDVKHEVAVIDSNNQTEYALVSVPKRKAKVASPEEHSEYDDILVTYSLPECVQP